MIALKQIEDLGQIRPLKEAYLRGLVFPMDSYWETAVVGLAPHWLLEIDGQQAGYFAAQTDRRLVQFYVADPFLPAAAELFTFVISGDLVQNASAGTFEPVYLSHCLDHQRHAATRSYLFEDHRRVKRQLNAYPKARFRSGSAADAEMLAKFHGQNDEYEDTEAINTGFGGRLNFVKALIEQGQVFLLINEGELIGVGEYRISESQPPYANLGMITDRNHRRKGVGTYILAKLKELCYRRGTKPICSCAADNVPSRKTIEKAGFISKHRLLDFWF